MNGRKICYGVQGIEDKLQKIEWRVCKLDSFSPMAYVDWEEHVERCIGDFPHTSFQLGAMLEKKIVGYLGICWHIHVMGRKGKISWEDLKEDLREFLKIPPDYHRPTFEDLLEMMEQGSVSIKKNKNCIIDMSDDEKKDVVEEKVIDDSVKELVIVEEANISILEESIDDIQDSCVQELEIENHEEEMIEIDEGEEERVVIKFEKPEEVQVMDAIDLIDDEIELQDLNDHQWIFKDEIDRSHDEWYKSMGKHLSINMGYWAEEMKNPWSNAERLWELLFQRGIAEREELHEPSSAGHVYLMFFEFCRLIFDP